MKMNNKSLSKKTSGQYSGYVLSFYNSSLNIVSDLGCNTVKLILNNQSVIDGNEDPKKLEADYLCKGDFMAPFPNRISDGRYTFQGNIFQLEINEADRGHALHGFIMKKKFDLASSEETDEYSKATFVTKISSDEVKGYPFDIEVKIVFTLKINELLIEMGGKNTGQVDAPFGIGWHPYFTVNKKIDDCFLQIPATSILETDSMKELIPTGKHLSNDFGSNSRLIKDVKFDTCFVDLVGQTTIFENIEIFMEENMKYLQIYTPENRQSIAIEPMSCAPDAFNNQWGLKILNPQKEISYSFGVRIS
jgi:aldose 1-epimerase